MPYRVPSYPEYYYEVISLGSKTKGFWPFKKKEYDLLTLGIKNHGIAEVKIIKKSKNWLAVEIRPTQIVGFSCSKEGLRWLYKNVYMILQDLKTIEGK